MSATPNIFCAINEYRKHTAIDQIGIRLVYGFLFSIYLKSFEIPIPVPIANTKKANIQAIEIKAFPFLLIYELTTETDPFAPAIVNTIESTITPITSSIIAALIIIVPTLVCNFPSSRKTSTVIPTLVAVIITPTKSQEYIPASRRKR